MEIKEKMKEYKERMGLINSKYTDLTKAPESIQTEYHTLNQMVIYLDQRYAGPKTRASDGFLCPKYELNDYEQCLSTLNECQVKNESVITPEDKEKYKMNIKTSKKIEEYTRRLGVIHQKYPDLNEAPKSIADEYSKLNTLLVGLENVQFANWGMTETSDGFQVDGFLIEKYEEALTSLEEVQAQNSEFITKEEEESFRFPEIDFEGLRAEMGEMQNLADVRALQSKISELQSQPLPREMNENLSKIIEEMYTISAEKELKEPERKIEGGQMPVVSQSKFEQIYDNAKGKVKAMLSAIKNRFSSKNQDQVKENEEDERE